MGWLAIGMAALVAAGIGQAAFGAFAVRRFARRLARVAIVPAADRPPVTVLKPLHGDEPMLEAALASLLAQDYAACQIVFGVQSPADAALPVIARLRERFPNADVTVVVNPALHGANRKIGNLINMLPFARHDVLVIADSDVHVAPDYLQRIVGELAEPNAGLVTTVYTGLSASASLAGALGATAITHGFFPGAIMARALGRQDCLGATMALRRETLEAVGGFAALVDHIADDHVLGKLVRAQGMDVRLAPTITATTVPESALPELFQHELRWARTILALVPREYALSTIQYPLFWAGLAIGFSGGEDWAVVLFLAAWIVRAFCADRIDRCIAATHPGYASPVAVWLMPLRDLMSMFTALSSYGGDKVEWRGQVMHTTSRIVEPDYAPAHRVTPSYVPSGYAPPGPSTAS